MGKVVLKLDFKIGRSNIFWKFCKFSAAETNECLFICCDIFTFNIFFRFIVKDRETFFSSAQRSQIVWAILMRTPYDDEDVDKVIF